MGKLKAKQNKKQEQKTKPGITAYNLFSKHIRPKIKAQNPAVSPQEMFKLIGSAWKDADKPHWERMAKETNRIEASTPTDESSSASGSMSTTCPFCNRGYMDTQSFKQHMIDTHNARADSCGSLNCDPPSNQARIHKCTECGKLVTSERELDIHIQSTHAIEALLVENHQGQESTNSLEPEPIAIGNLSLEPENHSVEDTIEVLSLETLEENVSNENDKTDNDAEENSFQLSQIVFVKRKTIFWPGEITIKDENSITIRIFCSGSIVKKDRKNFQDIKPFVKDDTLVKGRTAAWVSSYKEACLKFVL